MSGQKKALRFMLALLPIAAVATYFTVLYQIDLYDAATVALMIEQLGSMQIVVLISVIQTLVYVAFCGFFGYILAEKTGLMKPIAIKKKPLLLTIGLSVAAGIVFSLDYWTFGAWIGGVRESTLAGMTASGWIASILYGGIVEEVMLRLFVLSLISWLLWKLFFRKAETVPEGAHIAANLIAALLFAAGHLPATVTAFGTLTPLILLRCFLLNGGFGLLFGWLFRKHGIQYAMLSHGLLHTVSKLIWLIFV